MMAVRRDMTGDVQAMRRVTTGNGVDAMRMVARLNDTRAHMVVMTQGCRNEMRAVTMT